MIRAYFVPLLFLFLVGCASSGSQFSQPSESPRALKSVAGNPLVSPENGRYQGPVGLRELRALARHYSMPLEDLTGRRLVLSFFEGSPSSSPYYASPETKLFSGDPACAVFSAVNTTSYGRLNVTDESQARFRQLALFGFLHEVGHCFGTLGAPTLASEFDLQVSNETLSEIYADLFAISQMRCFVAEEELNQIVYHFSRLRSFRGNMLVFGGSRYMYGSRLKDLYPAALTSSAFFPSSLPCPSSGNIDIAVK